MVLTRSKAKQESNFDREAGAHKLGSWDQFQANKDLVKGASTYKEELYTTPLPPDPSSELEQRAEDIALSITNSIEGVTPDTGRQQTSSEEELFSSVRPTENSVFQFEGAAPSSLSQSKSTNKAVKEKCERHNRGIARTEYNYDDDKLIFPDLTPQDLDFSLSGGTKVRKKKKRPKGISLSQLHTQLCTESGGDSDDRDSTDASTSVHSSPAESPLKKLTPKTAVGKRKRPQQVSKTTSPDAPKAETMNNAPEPTPTQNCAIEKTHTTHENTRKCPFEGCTWKTGPHGGQWQAFHNHVANRHGDEVPDEWWKDEGRFRCHDCNKHYDQGKRETHDKICMFRHSSPQSRPSPSTSSADPVLSPNVDSNALPALNSPSTPSHQSVVSENVKVSDTPLPSLSSISALLINTCKDIPNSCRQEWAKTLCGCLSTAARENTLEAWTLLAMLPKCVLPAPHRGGNRAKASYASHVKKCLARWSNKDFLALWKEAVSSVSRKKKNVPQALTIDEEVKKAALRAERLVRDAELSRAMTALTSEPLAPDDYATYSKLQAKHPQRLDSTFNVASPSAPEAKPLEATEDEVAEALATFHRGSSGGAFGMRPEHVQAAMQYHHDAYTDPLGTLTKFTNHLLAGKAPLEVKDYFAGGRLCALKKGEHDVRPIAAGETLRRLASKVACLSAKFKARKLFRGHQYGVATPAGAERIIHLCRKTFAEHIEDDDFLLCKVDLKNAFNNVSRDFFVALTRQHFPELGAYVEWCYNTQSILTFGSRFIESSEGVQQGDPWALCSFRL